MAAVYMYVCNYITPTQPPNLYSVGLVLHVP